jgi:hypothetical protein
VEDAASCQLQSIKEGGTLCFEFEIVSHHSKTHFILSSTIVFVFKIIFMIVIFLKKYSG